MKKFLALLLTGLLCLLTLTACGGKDTDGNNGGSMGGGVATAGNKLGLGSVTMLTMGDATHTTVKTTAAAVLLDADGKILTCKLDETEYALTMADGAPTAAVGLTSKYEQGETYSLSAADTGETDGDSDTKNPWYKQVDAFCDYVKGKTAAEVSAIAATDGKSEAITGFDLVITDFIQAVRKAADSAAATKATQDNKLELALNTEKYAEATDEKPQYDTDMAAVARDTDGKATGCVLDTVQAKMTVAEGAFTTVSGSISSKKDKGDAYGMKNASSIKKEWFEQAAAFEGYVVGKTADELEKLNLNDSGKTDAISGCTITVSGLIKNTVKALRQGT